MIKDKNISLDDAINLAIAYNQVIEFKSVIKSNYTGEECVGFNPLDSIKKLYELQRTYNFVLLPYEEERKLKIQAQRLRSKRSELFDLSLKRTKK